MSDDPKRIVASGYDSIAERYAEWAASFESPQMRWLERLFAKLEDGSQVLELGCGGGGPMTLVLAGRHRLLGVDISPRQIERARARVPGATFRCADATQLELEPDSFDAVVSLFMLGHVPRAEQAPLLAAIASWLRPGGWLLATMGTAGAEDEVEDDWLGAPMFFASFDEETNRQLLSDAGFELVEARTIPIEEPGHGLTSFMYVLGRLVG
ncbi:MAG TPA: class I SAM-dependent methyltransferase [Gaiellaceae bacterium]|nr:class I SAM-dependent methyltransferase [Gaiellaceae bacterium]